MRIILIRHGESEGNVDWNTYSRIGDPHVSLTDNGWGQARDAGVFLRDWFNDPARGNRPGRWPYVWHSGVGSESPDAPSWPHIYVSSFLRTRQTLSGILTGMGDDALAGDYTIREDTRLVEHSFGALAYIDTQKGFLRRAFARALVGLSAQVHKHSPYLSYPPFGESPMAVQMRISDFIGSLHRAHDKNDSDDIMIVAHGGVIKAFMMRWFHLPLSAYDDLKTPGNCDVFVIEKPDPCQYNGSNAKPGWTITRIYDGQAGVAVNDNPLVRVKLFADARLPQFPDRLIKR